MSKTELAHGKDSSKGYQNMRKHWIIPPTPSTCEKLQNDNNAYVANWAICSSYCWPCQCLECRHLSEKFTCCRKHWFGVLAGHSLPFESKWNKCFGIRVLHMVHHPSNGIWKYGLGPSLWWAILWHLMQTSEHEKPRHIFPSLLLANCSYLCLICKTEEEGMVGILLKVANTYLCQTLC